VGIPAVAPLVFTGNGGIPEISAVRVAFSVFIFASEEVSAADFCVAAEELNFEPDALLTALQNSAQNLVFP
jgi:hypothetical protein